MCDVLSEMREERLCTRWWGVMYEYACDVRRRVQGKGCDVIGDNAKQEGRGEGRIQTQMSDREQGYRKLGPSRLRRIQNVSCEIIQYKRVSGLSRA